MSDCIGYGGGLGPRSEGIGQIRGWSRRISARKIILSYLLALVVAIVLSCALVVYDAVHENDSVLISANIGKRYGVWKGVKTQKLPIVTFTSTRVTRTEPLSTSWPSPPSAPCVTCWQSPPVPPPGPVVVPHYAPQPTVYVQAPPPVPIFVHSAGTHQ